MPAVSDAESGATAGDEASLLRVITALEGAASEIDVTFARAGGQLGDGLGLFEGLKERLASLSTDLEGDAITRAGVTLTGVAGELRAIKGELRNETDVLRRLAVDSKDASQALERLLEHMRLITILARSARIEAVSIMAAGRDFGDFTSEIVTLTGEAQTTIQNCARDHGHLSVLLESALSAQRDFEKRYGHALSALADDLEATLAEVAERQRRSGALTGEAALHSGKIAMAAGGAIIALQSGDSIRQQLEHVIAALRLLASLGMAAGPGGGLDAPARQAAGLVLRRLQAAQLIESASLLAHDADAIERALALLAGDTTSLLDLVLSLYQRDGGQSGSFLADLEGNLARAADLLVKCDRARAGVDAVTATLATVLETCNETIAALSETVCSIVLIGINAGLRAARIGAGGRSLVVIAQELKFAADQVAGDAARLTPTFARMQHGSAELKNGSRLDSAHFVALNEAMSHSLDAMRDTGDRLGTTLGQLAREGGGFGAVVADARLAFSNAGAMSDLIASSAAGLAHPVAGLTMAQDPDVRAAVAALIERNVWPSYTMASERAIHQSVLDELMPDMIGAAPAATCAAGIDDLDDLLF